MKSLIKEFELKKAKAIEEYNTLTYIDHKSASTEDLGAHYEKIKNIKYPCFDKEEKEFYKSLTCEMWKNEIDCVHNSFINCLWTKHTKENLTLNEISELSIYSFEKYDELNSDSVKSMSNDYINSNDIIRSRIISGNCIYAIDMIDELSNEEKHTALKNSPLYAINKIIDLSKDEKEINEFIKLYICLGGEIDRIKDWEKYLTSELISLVIATSNKDPVFLNVLFENHPEYTMTHVYSLISKKPSAVHILNVVESGFGDIYLQTAIDPNCELTLLEKLYNEIRDTSPIDISILFTETDQPWLTPKVKLIDFCNSYKELYI